MISSPTFPENPPFSARASPPTISITNMNVTMKRANSGGTVTSFTERSIAESDALSKGNRGREDCGFVQIAEDRCRGAPPDHYWDGAGLVGLTPEDQPSLRGDQVCKKRSVYRGRARGRWRNVSSLAPCYTTQLGFSSSECFAWFISGERVFRRIPFVQDFQKHFDY